MGSERLKKIMAGLIMPAPLGLASAGPAEIIFGIPSTGTLPFSEIRDDHIRRGILLDLGEAIAKKLNRQAEFRLMPRKRIAQALTAGAIDGVCYTMPAWLTVQANWSQPLIPNNNLIAADTSVPVIHSAQDIAGLRIGTVIGYVYPEIEQAIGNRYVRDDAPTMLLNIRKLAIGRYHYAIVDRLSWAYASKSEPELRALPTLPISAFSAACAFSLASKIPFADVDKAINTLIKDQTVEHILANYR